MPSAADVGSSEVGTGGKTVVPVSSVAESTVVSSDEISGSRDSGPEEEVPAPEEVSGVPVPPHPASGITQARARMTVRIPRRVREEDTG